MYQFLTCGQKRVLEFTKYTEEEEEKGEFARKEGRKLLSCLKTCTILSYNI